MAKGKIIDGFIKEFSDELKQGFTTKLMSKGCFIDMLNVLSDMENQIDKLSKGLIIAKKVLGK